MHVYPILIYHDSPGRNFMREFHKRCEHMHHVEFIQNQSRIHRTENPNPPSIPRWPASFVS